MRISRTWCQRSKICTVLHLNVQYIERVRVVSLPFKYYCVTYDVYVLVHFPRD